MRLAAAALLLAAALPARAQLGIDLSAPPKKDKPAEKKPPQQGTPAPGVSLRPLDLGKKGSGAKERLEAAKRLGDDKAYETAALAYDQILREPALADGHEEARYQLVKVLERLGLHYSALVELDRILERGQGSKYFHTAMEWVFYVGKRLKNEQPLLSRVARLAGESFPPAYQDRYLYLLAKYQFERGRALQEAGRASEARSSFDEARRLASRVRKEAGAAAIPASAGDLPAAGEEGDTYAKARFVDGLVLYAEGDQAGAAESFKEVVRLTNPKRNRRVDPALRELAFLQLARIHYENRQNRYAIFYYDKMPWGGESWLEGLWEASYAHYRIGDYEKALGNLLTLQSPYFKEEYFPESYILKAIIYYENCRYPESRAILEDFSGMFEPVYDELQALTTRAQPATAFFDLIEEAEKRPDTDPQARLMRKIMKLAFTDENIKRLSESIGEIEDELGRKMGALRPEFRHSALAKDLQGKLQEERKALVEEGGRRARQKLEYERDQLRGLLAQALRIKIEVSRKEREALEGSLATGSQPEILRDLKFSTAVSDEHLYWPYEGEYWRDELGTYAYTLTKGCKDRPQRAAR
ncbi:MAG TPA: adventurous gliding motility protein GltC [Anaeromyxobacteraceae bacterium]|nr:adventurous gliding motility protein GltC [Anaeromyxobacteraceae bacterium]